MKIFHNEEIYIKTDNFSDSIFKENTMFFDIETTGFSPVKAIVYMIGCARRIKNRIVIDQYFAESVDDEAAVIEAFAGSLSGCSTIISFNGVGFDIPFLKNKYKKYKQEDPFCNVQILDIFKELSPIKPLLCLENYKQKSIEAFLGIDREDKYSGGELINVYYEYLAQKDDEKLSLLLTHNYEDVLGMTKLLSILSYKECIHGIADITGVSVNPYTAYDGSMMNELIISFENKFSVPKSVSFHDNDIYLTIGTTKKLCACRDIRGGNAPFLQRLQKLLLSSKGGHGHTQERRSICRPRIQRKMQGIQLLCAQNRYLHQTVL